MEGVVKGLYLATRAVKEDGMQSRFLQVSCLLEEV